MSTLSPLRRAILVVGGLLSLGIIAVAVVSLIDTMGRTTRTQTWQADAGDKVTIRSGTGDIDLVSTNDTRVHITADLKYGLLKPTLTQSRDENGALRLNANCNDWLPFSNCGVHFTVAVPVGKAVDVRSTAGDINATDLKSTDITLHSTAGDIVAEDITGTTINLSTTAGDINVTRTHTDSLTLNSTAGDVVGDDLARAVGTDSGHFGTNASTTAGDINLNYLTAPDTVTAKATAGDVVLGLPGVPGGYDLTLRGDQGRDNDSVENRADSPRKIDARSTVGTVVIEPLPVG
jgi:putative adhesin